MDAWGKENCKGEAGWQEDEGLAIRKGCLRKEDSPGEGNGKVVR